MKLLNRTHGVRRLLNAVKTSLEAVAGVMLAINLLKLPLITGEITIQVALEFLMTESNLQIDHLMRVEAAEAEVRAEVEATMTMVASEAEEEQVLVEAEHASSVEKRDISLENVQTKTLVEETEVVIVEADQVEVPAIAPAINVSKKVTLQETVPTTKTLATMEAVVEEEAEVVEVEAPASNAIKRVTLLENAPTSNLMVVIDLHTNVRDAMMTATLTVEGVMTITMSQEEETTTLVKTGVQAIAMLTSGAMLMMSLCSLTIIHPQMHGVLLLKTLQVIMTPTTMLDGAATLQTNNGEVDRLDTA